MDYPSLFNRHLTSLIKIKIRDSISNIEIEWHAEDTCNYVRFLFRILFSRKRPKYCVLNKIKMEKNTYFTVCEIIS